MGVNEQVSLTWNGHGTWRARSAVGKEILIDAWVMSNPAAPEHLKAIDRCDLMLITHGHPDHVGDAVEIALAHRPHIVCAYEIGLWLQSKGVAADSIHATNRGGRITLEGIGITMVPAEHSSGITDGGQVLYGGLACGYVVEFENGFITYFSGDTDVFGDMRLIGELHGPDLAVLSIGDHYTMGPRGAAKAIELLGVKLVAPSHFGTAPILSGRPQQVQELAGPDVRVLDIKPGDTI